MNKRFKCPSCKKIMVRDVARNCVRRLSYCQQTGKRVTMKRVKQ